jgi:DNA (cytosine-5)-methyltransferase 3A
MNVLSLFDGISCGQIALNKANIQYNNYFASEIDKNAIKVAQHHYPNTVQLGDVTKIEFIASKIDLLIGGSPCQSFSKSGKMEGFDGKSGLFFEYLRIKEEVKPTYWLLENVKMKKEWKDIISDYLGVQPILINSNLFSAQNRPRYYWTNISISDLVDKGIKLEDIVLDDVLPITLTEVRTEEAKRIRRESMLNGKDFSPRRAKELVQRKDNKSNCLTATFSTKEHLFKNKNEDGYRKMLPIEWERLQTIPDNYTLVDGMTNSQRYKMIGNGWTVDVIAHIFENLKNIEL